MATLAIFSTFSAKPEKFQVNWDEMVTLFKFQDHHGLKAQ